MFFKGQQRLTVSPPCLCLPACLCFCCRLSRLSSILTFLFSKQSVSRSVVTTHSNAAHRIASHCIKSYLVTVRWFLPSLPLISFVESVPGPVPVLALLCPVSTLSCPLGHHHHQSHHINRTLVPPPRPRSTTHDLPRSTRCFEWLARNRDSLAV